MSFSSSESQHYHRKRKLSLSHEVDDASQRRRHLKTSLRLEIPTNSVETTDLELESAISGADSLFDDIFDEASGEETSTGTLPSSHSLVEVPKSSSSPLPLTLGSVPALRSFSSRLHSNNSIPGLFFDPSILIPADIANEVFDFCLKTYFSGRNANVNQVMLFGRASPPPSEEHESDPDSDPDKRNTNLTGLPPPLLSLLSSLSSLLLPSLPPITHSLLFPDSSSGSASPSPNLHRARQAIINLYHPGEGITPHVDLLRRFGDGILGVSFGSGCVMEFRKVGEGEDVPETYAAPSSGTNRLTNTTSTSVQTSGSKCEMRTKAEEGEGFGTDAYDVYLPERSVIVMSGDARYKWTHGIPRRKWDYVEDVTQDDTRVGLDEGLREDSLGNKDASKNEATGSTTERSEGRGRCLERGTRLSITFRFLLPGAEIVGLEEEKQAE
ncbi:hypothetical protein K435DRAFT_294743 [Dendrothele bispora CBS 962.96]|uniref:Fe2OG dioxygenase domain-containing protein n=1 Tax=Dendrothele bispora (strain CBS 962.96) TaxID=1314807 RepID=A0A4S8MKK6_DENBC|nr:hypothetical protein K435DRAFT_294743 [Dendrothele bispora CBS 962.96]